MTSGDDRAGAGASGKGESELATELVQRGDIGAPVRGTRFLAQWNGGAIARDFPDDATFIAGRSDAADVQIDATSVSRKHARFVLGAACSVEDLGSANGTFVDGVRLAASTPTPLRTGSLVELGTVLVTLHSGPSPAAAAVSVEDVVVEDPAMRRVVQLADLVARGKLSVLVLGETGVGKGLMAARLHAGSPRAAGPLVHFRSAGADEAAALAELFGAGDEDGTPGLLERAHGGTLVLDEVDALSLSTQAKLLQVIETGTVTRVGGSLARPIDVRLVACASADLDAAVKAGRFRQDLYFRLDGFSLRIPPLRDRRADVAPLALAFARDAAAAEGRPAPTFTEEALAKLGQYPWPGNVRELASTMARTVLVHTSAEPITPRDIAWSAAEGGVDTHDAERRRVVDALEKSAGNQTRAAKLLGISRRTLLNRLDAFGLPRPRKRDDEDEG